MNTHAEKNQENKSQSVASQLFQKRSASAPTFQFVGVHPETIAQRKLQEIADNSPQVKQLRAFQEMANYKTQVRQAAQVKVYSNNTDTVVQRENGPKKNEGKRRQQEEMDRGHDNYMAAKQDVASERASESEVSREEEIFLLEVEVDRLAGKRGAPAYPPGASGTEQDEIDSYAGMARRALAERNPRHARDLIDDLLYVLERARQQGLERQEVISRLDRLSDEIRDCVILMEAERNDLHDRLARVRETVEDRPPSTVATAAEGVDQRLAALATSTDAELAYKRLAEHVYKGSSQATRNAFAVYRGLIPDPKNWPGLLKIKLKQHKLVPYNIPVISVYSIDGVAGRRHAYDRHTFEGIYAARAVLTAHPTHVAIFVSVQDLDAALRGAPTAVAMWRPGRQSGRFDAEVGNIHYQGTGLMETMALNSVYPTNRSFPRQNVEDALGESTLEAFIDRLTN